MSFIHSSSLILSFCLWASAASAQELLKEDFKDSAAHRWLSKKVLDSRVLDNMESAAHWVAFSTGAPEVVDARATKKTTDANRPVSEMSLTREHSRDGSQSLRMRIPARLDVAGPKNGRGWGGAGVRRQFQGEDWRSFNRISLWIYADAPGFNVVSLEMRLYNEGVEKLPSPFGQEGETTVVLRNHEWNQVCWEIGNVARDKITTLEILGLMSGHEPAGADFLTFDFEQLTLEKVDPDYVEGWEVWGGRIAFSHAGYQSGASKTAIANGLDAREFRLIDEATGQPVLAKPIQSIKARVGQFQVMDFSEVRKAGSYILQAGETRTRPFRIDPNVWRESILKAINFLYAERCGMAIPGVHDICHRDWTMVHGDQRIVVNGGWHDAGDLTQGIGNTAEIDYALLSLAERLHARDEDLELYQRVMEEARWGLDWILKTSFGDGFRDQGSVNSRWTDGIIGTSDDVTATARYSALGSFNAAATEALAARVLRESDPRLAAYSLKMAQADWGFGCQGMTNGTNSAAGLWRGTFDSDNVEHEVPALGVLASVDLWQATGEKRFADKAVELAGIILASQERKRPNWDIPLVGFFYTGPSKERILHYCHRGREQGPVMALTRLCEAFPDHPDYMKWYSAVALYSEYLKTVAKYTEPYGMTPASIYQADEYLSVPEERKESFRKQVLNGIPLGQGHYLRLFPVWMNYRGNFGTILPQAQALMCAAHLRGDLESSALAQHQAEWIIGRNPFSQSAMYGEGYDYTPLYAPFPGNVVGALPVGMQTRGDQDAPYWPVQATWTYKEVWVHPVGRWLWLMRDLAGPALVQGQAGAPVEFIPANAGQVIQATPVNGRFRALLPEGKYTVQSQGQKETRVFLPAATYHLDLTPGRAVDFEVSKFSAPDGEVGIRVTPQKEASRHFQLRADNLDLRPINSLEWRGRILSPDTPWTVQVMPDANPINWKELTGAAWEK